MVFALYDISIVFIKKEVYIVSQMVYNTTSLIERIFSWLLKELNRDIQMPILVLLLVSRLTLNLRINISVANGKHTISKENNYVNYGQTKKE